MKTLFYFSIFILLNCQNNLFAQLTTKVIDINDSSFITYDSNVLFKTFDYYPPVFDLLEKLQKGKYFVYKTDKKKRKNIKLYGEYSDDSLKNGTFTYYESFEINEKKENLARMIYNFRNGKLDGSFCIFGGFNIYYSGNYNMGLKNGTFSRYSFGGLHYLEYESIYINDTLVKRIKYFENSNKVISEITEYKGSDSKYKITYFNENGLTKVAYESNENNTFLKTKYNDKGIVVSTEMVDRIEEKQMQQR